MLASTSSSAGLDEQQSQAHVSACVHAAFRSLGLPTEEEVKLLIQIVTSIPDPHRIPEGQESKAGLWASHALSRLSAVQKRNFCFMSCIYYTPKRGVLIGLASAEISTSKWSRHRSEHTPCATITFSLRSICSLVKSMLQCRQVKLRYLMQPLQSMACQLQSHLFARQLFCCNRPMMIKVSHQALV